jgi:hypothetical protein
VNWLNAHAISKVFNKPLACYLEARVQEARYSVLPRGRLHEDQYNDMLPCIHITVNLADVSKEREDNNELFSNNRTRLNWMNRLTRLDRPHNRRSSN